MKNIDKSVIGKVEIISGVPIYMYAVPADAYESSGKAITLGNTIKYYSMKKVHLRKS